jgi:hypothetical protein
VGKALTIIPNRQFVNCLMFKPKSFGYSSMPHQKS